jgi:hypothetical protein
MRGQRQSPAALYPRERPGIHCTEGWMGPRAGLDRCGKSRPDTGIRTPDLLARSQSLYRLRYPVHKFHVEVSENKVVIFFPIQVYRLPERYRRASWESTGLKMADVDSRMIE